MKQYIIGILIIVMFALGYYMGISNHHSNNVNLLKENLQLLDSVKQLKLESSYNKERYKNCMNELVNSGLIKTDSISLNVY